MVPSVPGFPPWQIGSLTFIISPRVLVRPAHELLVDPRQQPDRRVRHGVSDSLRLRLVYGIVSSFFKVEALSTLESFDVSLGIRRNEILQVEQRELLERGREGTAVQGQLLGG